MAKKLKIQRYDSKFRSSKDRRLRWVKSVLSLFVVGLLFMLGWAVYDPVYEFLTTRQQSGPEPLSSASEPSVSEPASTPEPSPPPAQPTQARALYLPPEVFKDAAQLDAQLALARQNGLDTVVLELKDEEGQLHYLTTSVAAATSGAVAADAVALGPLVQHIEDAGLRFGARVHVFRDPLMAGTNKDWAVKYQDTGLNWLDNSLDEGGRPWLNPYHAEARRYSQEILDEVLGAGCTLLVVDGLHLPTGYQLDSATYPGAGSTTPREALRSLLDGLDGREGVLITVETPVAALLGSGEALFGGPPEEVFDTALTVTMVPSMLPEQVTIGESKVTLPREVPTALAAQLAAETGPQRLVPYLEAAGGGQVALLRQALDQVGVTSYIFYSPTGEYDFS